LKKVIIVVFFVLLSVSSYAYEEQQRVNINIDKINWHTVIYDVINYYPANNVKPTDLEKFTHYYGDILIHLIAEIESDLKFTAGKINPKDISYFQIHTGTWSYSELSRLSGIKIMNQTDIKTYDAILAAHIWLYQVCLFRNAQGRFPRSIFEVLGVYHRPFTGGTLQYQQRIKIILARNNLTPEMFNFNRY
jgi:hypothetical protein